MSSAAARHDITRPSGVSDGVLVAPVVADEVLVVGVLDVVDMLVAVD